MTHDDRLSPEAADISVTDPHTVRRLTPSELHALRVAWGKKWGKLVSDATRHLRDEEPPR